MFHVCFRSRVNVVFRVGGAGGNEELEKSFVEEATRKGLLSLKGHRWVEENGRSWRRRGKRKIGKVEMGVGERKIMKKI